MAVHVRNLTERHQRHDLDRRRREDEPSSQLPPSPSLSSPAYPHRPSEILRLMRSPQLSLPLRSQRRNPNAAPELELALNPSGSYGQAFSTGLNPQEQSVKGSTKRCVQLQLPEEKAPMCYGFSSVRVISTLFHHK
ncbi:hypothetical protein Bca4012_058894 [Brassica carinata]